MPRVIKLSDGRPQWADDTFVSLGDEPAPAPGSGEAGGIILSLARFQAEREAWLASGRKLGVRLQPDEAVEDLADDLSRLAIVALVFPKFRDGRPYSTAALLRERYGFQGEIRAVGEVLRDQADFMIRCGFDAYEPSDGSTPEDWNRAEHRFRHVYQAAADDLTPAFRERGASPDRPDR
ncbi:MAG TPA: DUF934 domain-containing protein [Caulobacteraceae bacterium]|jgi:uncharacterized protein (DUF934 family)|nr:DUF934 domain-containing protein [Caulobacteraceae bacterium]